MPRSLHGDADGGQATWMAVGTAGAVVSSAAGRRARRQALLALQGLRGTQMSSSLVLVLVALLVLPHWQRLGGELLSWRLTRFVVVVLTPSPAELLREVSICSTQDHRFSLTWGHATHCAKCWITWV